MQVTFHQHVIIWWSQTKKGNIEPDRIEWTLGVWSQNAVTGFKPLNTRPLTAWSLSRVSRHRFTATIARNTHTIFEDTHSSNDKHSDDMWMIVFICVDWMGSKRLCGCTCVQPFSPVTLFFVNNAKRARDCLITHHEFWSATLETWPPSHFSQPLVLVFFLIVTTYFVTSVAEQKNWCCSDSF